jgi:ketosteroid isomerase-like protein
MRLIPSLILCTAFLTGHARAAAPAHDADVAAIRAVVQQFQTALMAHDGKTLDSLFLPDHDSWLMVADDATWTAAKARNASVPKVVRGTRRKFIESVQTGTKPIEERFRDVRIETNGVVASVYFDFDFLGDGKVENRGAESWQMVRAEDGWKIGSMLFSFDR